MRRAAAVLVLATLGWSVSGTALAQEAPGPLELSSIDTATHPKLSTILTAPSELSGEELLPGAVTVTEDGEVQPSTFVRLPDDRLEVVLVIDTSGSMQGAAFTSAKLAASAFLARLPADARVALVAFGSTPALASPLGAARNTVVAATQGLEARGETALYDAVRLATQQFSGAVGNRRSIVLLSDGGDTVSSVSLQAAAAAVAAAGAHLDVIELVTTESARAALDQLAGAGVGRVAPADDPSALAGIYDGIAASLANEYRLAWRSSSDGEVDVVVRLSQRGIVAQRNLTLQYPATPVADPQPARAELPAERSVATASWALPLGAACIAIALFVLGLVAFGPRHRQRRLARLGSIRRSVPDATALSGLVSRATASADAALERHGRRSVLNERLEQAGVALRPGEYVVLSLSAVALASAVGFVTSGPLLGALLAVVAGLGAHLVPAVLRSRRRSQFSDQLGDTLQQLAGTLRAGYGLLQSVDALGREAPEPTAGEFRRLVVETRLGRDVSTSLHAMARRIGTEDFEWVVQAIDIHREVGGDLAEVLDTVAGTIRERNQVMRQVKTLTAEGRLSAYILLALPVVLAGALRLINPGYFELLTFGPGLVLSGAAVVMLVLGALWFRKLCQLVY